MTRIITLLFLELTLACCSALATVDTLRDTSDIEDCIIYNYNACNSEVGGEDCHRYNSGGVINLGVGQISTGKNRRIVCRIPGWAGTIPDSSRLEIFCSSESDAIDRKIFLYPLTVRFFEGSEASYGVGDYPDPDSGVTWNHAYLDVGDGDSLNWTTAGGDYYTGVACTTTITGTGSYFAFNYFNRILNYWDSSGNDYGFILVNENAFPANSSNKTIKSTESGTATQPLVIQFFPDSLTAMRRSRLIPGM